MGKKLQKILLFFISISIVGYCLIGQEPLRPVRTDKPPVINGILDDAVWKQAPSVTGFKTFTPDYGKDMAEKSIVYMAYDRENLYFAFRCFDRQPKKIKASLSSRDQIGADDWVCINLDSFNDHQSLYGIYINPLGIQGDTRFAGNKEDQGFDMVWYSAGKINEEGYCIEVKLPLKCIRFSNKKKVEMGVIFERHISRQSEQGTYPHLSPDRGFDFLNQMRTMVYSDLKHYTLVEVLPALTYTKTYVEDQGKLVRDKKQQDFSLTAKYGITSDLILDGTYNPDFSQVEADAGQVDINLRYSLFYPEKRPFFLEGAENFNLASVDVWDSLQAVVHTRTIVDPVFGVKLSGKLGEKNRVAGIFAIDKIPDDVTLAGNNNAYFTILRYKRALKRDNYIGSIYTGRERGDLFNRVFGFDSQFRLGKSSMFSYYGLLSKTKEENSAKPEDGHALAVKYDYNTRDIRYELGINDLSEDFNTETGYVTRTGIFRIDASVKPKFYPKSKFIRRIDTELFTRQTRDKPSNMWETYNHLEFRGYILGTSLFLLRYAYSTEVFLGKRFKIGGWTTLFNSQVTKRLHVQMMYRKRHAIYFSEDPYQGRENIVTAALIYLPSSKIRSEIDFTYSDFFRASDSQKIFDYPITRAKLTYQMNKYLFFRGVLEYNAYNQELFTDFLASFTYIPGTVIHFGYGSVYDKTRFLNDRYENTHRFYEKKRGFFFKASYLWRL